MRYKIGPRRLFCPWRRADRLALGLQQRVKTQKARAQMACACIRLLRFFAWPTAAQCRDRACPETGCEGRDLRGQTARMHKLPSRWGASRGDARYCGPEKEAR